jgi:hypothetical protein
MKAGLNEDMYDVSADVVHWHPRHAQKKLSGLARWHHIKTCGFRSRLPTARGVTDMVSPAKAAKVQLTYMLVFHVQNALFGKKIRKSAGPEHFGIFQDG